MINRVLLRFVNYSSVLSKRNFTLLQQTAKDETVAIDKCNKNRTGSSRRKQIKNDRPILTILPPVFPPVN